MNYYLLRHKEKISRFKAFIILFLSFTFIGCNKISNSGNRELTYPSFSYDGYTYYLHPSLGKYDLNTAKQVVEDLASDGYTTWFLPSISELQIAADAGILDKNASYIWSSSTASDKLMWIMTQRFGVWQQEKTRNEAVNIEVFPMIKMRRENSKLDPNQEISIHGTLVSAPFQTPLKGIIIQLTNNSTTLSSYTTTDNGNFSFKVKRGDINSSYFLSCYEPTLRLQQLFYITRLDKEDINLGILTLYDENNPYALPTVTYSGYDYIIHPVLREKMSLDDAKVSCEELNDFGISDWFLPNQDELFNIAPKVAGTFNLQSGKYMGTNGYVGLSIEGGIYYWSRSYYGPNYMNGYVLPMSRY